MNKLTVYELETLPTSELSSRLGIPEVYLRTDQERGEMRAMLESSATIICICPTCGQKRKTAGGTP
jgi:hypothetical protein